MSVAPDSPRCPICKKAVQLREVNRAFPFCSARCKQVELGKWLNEEYRLPAEEDDEDAERGEGEQGSES
ncbi:MAG: DNA gyrase inhibitor YacG [Polyangiaceae bacterium]